MSNPLVKQPSSDQLRAMYNGKSVLVTGANGFVSAYLIPRLIELKAKVSGLDLQECPRFQGYQYLPSDLSSPDQAQNCIERLSPDIVFHLASQSSVGTSWDRQWETIDANVRSAYNLLSALERTGKPVRILLISSGEVYGDLGNRPSCEEDRLRPMNPYAVSKAMMEMIAHRYQHTSLYYIIARSYNHTGPGRPPTYFESFVAKQFAEARKAEQKEVTLRIGNIFNVRDYSDVRDVVEKYLILICSGVNGAAYNVCSGIGYSLKSIISRFEEIANVKARIELDESKIRKNDLSYFVGKSRMLYNHRPLTVTLKDLYESFLSQRI